MRTDTFAREPLMAWCEDNHVDYLFGFARNTRLLAMIADELTAARATAEKTDQPARRFKDFQWSFKMNAFWAPENFEPSSFFAPPGGEIAKNSNQKWSSSPAASDHVGELFKALDNERARTLRFSGVFIIVA
ncbi:transposase [Bradyrhizobium zhanjiangense]|uniref:Transposase DDE domain-containing protein n=1 Tax=Bradyrhizobium zhanjiangense TaxID=1325107 RepID=A0ABY0D8N1_9BRAD|nr:hypothetical protein EAS62_39865 [Bradyrhizobium zhanjiangense]